ncbi:hypothetical protein SAMN04488122_1598 [Chitinophaga arvensicola]|uniref:Uncharacterized protein n=1 Tax=Chitinophaga arvensicola TaxID=29529 RepID=A0A1I0QPV1_9BACT|nr:hypothetical protein SAMN04488122_1598 [Chitinophaga arvensicola]
MLKKCLKLRLDKQKSAVLGQFFNNPLKFSLPD